MADATFDAAHEYEALVQFLYIAPVGLVQASLDGEIVMINPVSAQLLLPLAPGGELTNLFTALEAVVPDLRFLVDSFQAPQGMVCDGVRIPLNVAASAKSRPSMLSLTLLKLDEGRLMAVINDITQQVARERLLKQNEAWLNAIMMGVTEYALVRLDRNGRIDDWNPSIGRITGFDSDATVGQPFSVFYPAGSTTPERLLDRLREADESGWSLDEGWRLKADGTRFWGSAMITPLEAPLTAIPCTAQAAAGTALAGAPVKPPPPPTPAYSMVIRDITEKREASEAQRRAIACDHLTGIGNRRTFFEAAELEFSRGQRSTRWLSLLMLDLDRFKDINDQYGHPVGDIVLRDFAALLSACFREVDIVARIGGEEFAVLMPSTDRDEAERAAERLRRMVASHAVQSGGHTVHYTVSGGIATVDSAGTDLETLMRKADSALYTAKDAGRNRISTWDDAGAAPTGVRVRPASEGPAVGT